MCISLGVACAQVTVTYLANEGVMIRSGESKVLIDPFFKESFKLYQTLPIRSLESFLKQHAELKSANAILISHRHRDHIDAGWVAEYLKLNPEATLLSSSQATDSVVNQFGV